MGRCMIVVPLCGLGLLGLGSLSHNGVAYENSCKLTIETTCSLRFLKLVRILCSHRLFSLHFLAGSTPPRFPHRGVGPAPAPDLLGKAALGHSGSLHCRRAARRARQVRGPRPHSLRSSHRLHGYDRQRPLVVVPRPPLTRGLSAINPVHRHV